LREPRGTYEPGGSASEDFVNFRGEQEIEITDSLNAVGIQIDNDFVPDIEPFGMVVHGFGDEGNLRHVAKGSDEILALEGFVQFAIHKAPTPDGLELLLNFGAGEFLCLHGNPPMAGWE
jgi:hypothetical protein